MHEREIVTVGIADVFEAYVHLSRRLRGHGFYFFGTTLGQWPSRRLIRLAPVFVSTSH